MNDAVPAPSMPVSGSVSSQPTVPGFGSDGDYSKGGQAVAFVFGTIGVVSVVLIPAVAAAIVLYAFAYDRVDSAPATARTLMICSWVVLIVSVCVLLPLFVLIAVMFIL